MTYDGYLSPYLESIVEFAKQGWGRREIADWLFEGGVRAYSTSDYQKTNDKTPLINMVGYVLKRVGAKREGKK